MRFLPGTIQNFPAIAGMARCKPIGLQVAHFPALRGLLTLLFNAVQLRQLVRWRSC